MKKTDIENPKSTDKPQSQIAAADSTSAVSVPKRGVSLSKIGISALVAMGGLAFAVQHAQAFSALDVVNKVTTGGGVGVSKDILYGDAPSQDLDVYYPKPLAQAMRANQSSIQSYPMVVFVHGGSWQNGSKDDYAFVGESLAQAGYVTAVINYRKAPAHVYPDYVEDTARAIAWSHENAADLHADPQRFAVVGHSAGAFNVMAAVSDADFLAPYGMQPADISAVVGIAGPYSYDFRNYPTATAFPADATPDEVMPDRHIKGKQPPYLLLTAEKDKIVNDANTLNMTQALKKYGALVDNGVIKGASHASSIGSMAAPLRWLNDSRAQVLNYLDAKLTK